MGKGYISYFPWNPALGENNHEKASSPIECPVGLTAVMQIMVRLHWPC